MFRRLTDLERRLRRHYNVVPVDAGTWARARIYNTWFDHAFLRHLWTNEAQIAPGVWRSNHPTRGRLERLKARGITTVLSLRGGPDEAHTATERLWCADLGLEFETLGLSDKAAPPAEALTQLIETFRRVERPFLMHCKSGADRAGLASAVYLMTICDAPLSRARAMLSPRYLHLRSSRAGVLDAVLDAYAADGAEAVLPFELWVESRYDAQAVNAGFMRSRGRG